MKQVRNVTSSMFFLREEKTLMTSDGSYIVQTIYRTQPSMTVTAVSEDRTDFQSRASNDVAPMGIGYEHVINSKLAENAARWANDAVEKLSAKPVDPGKYDLILHPSNLWLTLHETVAHPTELDRAMGYEANYAGTSFVAPPEKVLGQLKFGSSVMNIQGDREQPGSLAAIGWDDEAVKPDAVRHHQGRHLRGLPDHARAGVDARVVLQEGRQAGAVVRLLVRTELGRRAVPAHAQCLAPPRARTTTCGRT